jgi:DNA-directed RNA polymerase subunit E'/Rpb7
LGLCVSIYDIKSVEGGFVLPGDGAATYKVGLRIVVFRPFVGEVIAAKFKESDANGLRCEYFIILFPEEFQCCALSASCYSSTLLAY